jgi:hypothetical protein
MAFRHLSLYMCVAMSPSTPYVLHYGNSLFDKLSYCLSLATSHLNVEIRVATKYFGTKISHFLFFAKFTNEAREMCAEAKLHYVLTNFVVV